MVNQIRQYTLGHGEIISKLGAAERMGKVVQTVDGACNQILILLHQCFCHTVDATDNRKDPDLIADSDFSVGSAVSLECPFPDIRQGEYLMVVGIISAFGEPGAHIVRVHPGTRSDIFRCDSNRVSEFDDVGTARNITQGDLVSAWNILERRNASSVCRISFFAVQLFQGNGNIIIGMDFDQIHGNPP